LRAGSEPRLYYRRNVTGTFWEDVYDAPPLAGLERVETEPVFGWLEGRLPLTGSKIDWDSVQGEHAHRHFVDDVAFADAANQAVVARVQSGARVQHVGDGLSPHGVWFEGEDAVGVVAALLEVPENHYFLDEGRTWLVVVSMEGDLDILDLRSVRD